MIPLLRTQAVMIGAFGGSLIARWLLGNDYAMIWGACLGVALLLWIVAKDDD